jgi:hypothetical protein
VPPTPGTYECPKPDCRHKQKADGFCPSHDLPLRLLRYKR